MDRSVVEIFNISVPCAQVAPEPEI